MMAFIMAIGGIIDAILSGPSADITCPECGSDDVNLQAPERPTIEQPHGQNAFAKCYQCGHVFTDEYEQMCRDAQDEDY